MNLSQSGNGWKKRITKKSERLFTAASYPDVEDTGAHEAKDEDDGYEEEIEEGVSMRLFNAAFTSEIAEDAGVDDDNIETIVRTRRPRENRRRKRSLMRRPHSLLAAGCLDLR